MKIRHDIPDEIDCTGKSYHCFVYDQSSDINFIIPKGTGLIYGTLSPGESIINSDYWSELTCDGIDFDAKESLDLLEEFRLIELRYYKLLSKGFTPKQAISKL